MEFSELLHFLQERFRQETAVAMFIGMTVNDSHWKMEDIIEFLKANE